MLKNRQLILVPKPFNNWFTLNTIFTQVVPESAAYGKNSTVSSSLLAMCGTHHSCFSVIAIVFFFQW